MSMITGRRILVDCISCGESIDLGSRARVGQILDCPNCDTLLEVISLTPAKLSWFENDSFEEDEYGDDMYYDDEFEEDFDEDNDYDYEYDDY